MCIVCEYIVALLCEQVVALLIFHQNNPHHELHMPSCVRNVLSLTVSQQHQSFDVFVEQGNARTRIMSNLHGNPEKNYIGF